MNKVLESLIRKSCPTDEDFSIVAKAPKVPKNNVKVNIVGLGDVGLNLLLGLKLLGKDVVSEIGIYSRKKANSQRLEMEFNQIHNNFEEGKEPVVKIVEENELMDCDVFIFAASASVPALGAEKDVDVRLIQLEENAKLVGYYGKMASAANFKGLFAVVSDPVDELCLSLLDSCTLPPTSIKGYGLGVMNARARYYSKQEEATINYEREGRAFGPHGKGLVIINSIKNFDEKLSQDLTEKAVTANLKVRELGFKPFYAPAFSSGAYSILATIKQEWHYSNVYIDGKYLGIKNRFDGENILVEKLEMCDEVFDKIEKIWW